jgi:uncharacterized protein involved in outer membrane biogenesis
MSGIPFRTILKRTLQTLVALVLLLVALGLIADIPPIHDFLQNRFHHRIERALSTALGRSVVGRNLEFTALSGIGIKMENISIAEAPGFGPEQFLFAEQVHFVLSWHSLWSKRLEFSRITLRGASINLVRNRDGRWNFETWFAGSGEGPRSGDSARERVAGSGTAPSSFPFTLYLDSNRINFKDLSGSYEKKVFFLADVSGKIEAAWFSNGIDFDLQLKPSRTDVPLENSGLIRLTGSIGPFRTASFWTTAIQGQARVEKFPYSDVAALLTARTTYLHGLVAGRASFHGQLNDRIHLAGQLDLLDLHSWAAYPRDRFTSASLIFSEADLQIGQAITLTSGQLHIGSSVLKADFRVEGFIQPQVECTLAAEKLRLDDGLDFARGFSSQIPLNTHLAGDAKFNFGAQGGWKDLAITAKVSAEEGKIQSDFLIKPATIAPFEMSFVDGRLKWTPLKFAAQENRSFQLSGSVGDVFASPVWKWEATGRETPLALVENIGRSFGLWKWPVQTEGIADFSLEWGGAKRPAGIGSPAGTVYARDVTLKVGTKEDIRIASARFEAKNGLSALNVAKISWGRSVASGDLQFPGIDYRRGQLLLNASFLDLNELLQLGNEIRTQMVASASEFKAPSAGSATPGSSGFIWNGKLSSTWLYFRQFKLTNVRSSLAWQQRTLSLDDFSLETFGGRSKGQFHLDWQSGQPRLRMEGHVDNIKLDALANSLTALGPVAQGRITGNFALSGEKPQGQPWNKNLTTQVSLSVRDLKNASLNIPSSIQEIKTRLNLLTTSASKDVPLALDIELEYGPEQIKIANAQLTRSDFIGTFSGLCSKRLELDLNGAVERVTPKKTDPVLSLTVGITGPLDHAQVVIKSPGNVH